MLSFAGINKIEINNDDAVHKHYTSINCDDCLTQKTIVLQTFTLSRFKHLRS